MKRIYIVVEGQTEERFVKDTVTPYLNRFNIWSVTPILIHTSATGRGGFVNYMHLRNEIVRLLRSEKTDFIVSTFVDFFRCPKLPGYEIYKDIASHKTKAEMMEKCISDDINDSRLMPYIQLHEFEALLFSSNAGFQLMFEEKHAKLTESIVESFDNPEDINSTPEGAPSKRILAINKSFDKVADGVDIANVIGLDTILQRCPRFAQWIGNIIDICTNNSEN